MCCFNEFNNIFHNELSFMLGRLLVDVLLHNSPIPRFPKTGAKKPRKSEPKGGKI